ncbi:MAG TPA: hypothetical protein VGD04_01240 [Methylophilus sp.]|nr:hypothetical protein [Methylophilus sp.]
MASPGVTPQSNQRSNIKKAYAARGRGLGNLWLVYSVKTKSSWILPSDRQLIHWLCLESNPEVESFDLAPKQIISHDGTETRATELDAIVIFKNRQVQWHEVKAGTNKKEPSNQSQFNAQAAAASKEHVEYKIINDTYLKPKVRVALRWLKALGYADIIKDHQHTSCHRALENIVKTQLNGNIQQLVLALEDFDSSIVLGVLVRLAIAGIVELNLEKSSFGLQTRWIYHG